jgi:predicted glycoside hydrolase/deacetylase ChbG (UPF0249 family)
MALANVTLCADDYAVHACASQGIVALARQQRLSATSVMSLSPRWAADAPALRELKGQVSVGLHLDWTSDFARAAGHGQSLAAMMWRALWGGFVADEVRICIERQLDAFEAHWQAPPDHVDGHQHIQQFQGIRGPLLSVLAQRYGSHLPWLRISQVAQADAKACIISAWGARPFLQAAQAQNAPCRFPLRGAYNFAGGRAAYARRMQDWLRAAAHEGGVLMCHPAQGQDAGDPIGAARAWEFEYLASDDFVHDLQQARVQLHAGVS